MIQDFSLLFPQPATLKLDRSAARTDYSALLAVIPATVAQVIPSPSVSYRQDDSLSGQGFVIRVAASGIEIAMADEPGRLYAHQCLAQLIELCHGQVPSLIVGDQPAFAKRGIIVDISRDKVPTMATLFQLVDFWSALRINQLQLYTEHTFAYPQHQAVWQDYSPMTAEEIRTLDRYCRERGIALIPNQATFGHMEKWLCHPQYRHLAEQTTGFYDQRGDFRPESFGLNPLSDSVTEFIAGLLDALLPNFSSDTLNLNFDETMDLGAGASQQACEQQGKGQVYLNYLKTVLNLAHARGKSCQIFSDMLFQYPDILPHLPGDLELLNWGYEEDHPYDDEHRQLAEFGYPFQVVVSTNTFASVTGRGQAVRVHMRRAAESALKYGACGYQISEWGDMGHAQQHFTSLPGYVFGAAMAWDPQRHASVDAGRLVCAHFGGAYAQALPLIDRLQDAYLTSGVTTPNCAFYGPFVFDQRSGRHIRRAEIASAEQIAAAMDDLSSLKADIAGLPASALQAELLWTADCMLLASQIALSYANAGHCDLTALPRQDKARILDKLAPVEEAYADLWLQHYRPGGLKQSASRLGYLRELCQVELEPEVTER
ncbi:family 20 glycosylhydrolase [Photobacterium halotolerans]|uniref:family 20 glycosylhydrolase n=1 Tax=Photobacterium halotolerans TaxID=265726 RepID=UPI000425EE2B|nr:family 20 glycosylhydrolase [Photobacterium halotolerans]